MIRPDLIIFDCDGVLVDSEVLSCRRLSETLARYGISLSVDQALDLFLGRSLTTVFEHYEGLGRPIPQQFAAELRTGVRAAFVSSLCPIEGVKSVLEDLQIPHCVASSSDVDRVSFSLALTGLAPHFDTRLYTSQMVARGKPAPDLFLYAAERMRADPRRTLVIEDSVSGVQAGKAAGMTVWGFVGGSHYAVARRHAPCCSRPAPIGCLNGWRISGEWTVRRSMACRPTTKSRVSTTPRAPAGSTSSPATPRTKSPRCCKVSRASAQRLVSLCLAERLITFRLEHPIAACMELARAARRTCSISPTARSCRPIRPRRCRRRHRRARREHPGNDAARREAGDRRARHGQGGARRGRARFADRLSRITRSCRWSATSRPTARPASSTPSARLADRTKARHYPMPLPFLMSSEARARPDAPDRPDRQGAGGCGKGRPAPGRHRADGPERAGPRRRLHHRARNCSR